VRIAIDVLGGDHAPDEILSGVVTALGEDFTADELLLVGPESTIRESMAAAKVDCPPVLHTNTCITAGEKPGEALRRKSDASIALAVGAIKEGKAGGLISFGNTGAAVAASTLGLGRLPGVRFPGIAVVFQASNGPVVLLDVGANPQPKPLHLQQYALMGVAYCRDMFGMESPRVGLLNIGGEEGKGHATVQEAHKLMQDAPINFVGNVEGQELFHGVADVLVTDGFVGNMIIKVVEGFLSHLQRGAQAADQGEDMMDTLRHLVGVADFSEYGGAALLGVDGVVLIGHGRSKADAVLPALRSVRKELKAGVNSHISEMVAQTTPAS